MKFFSVTSILLLVFLNICSMDNGSFNTNNPQESPSNLKVVNSEHLLHTSAHQFLRHSSESFRANLKWMINVYKHSFDKYYDECGIRREFAQNPYYERVKARAMREQNEMLPVDHIKKLAHTYVHLPNEKYNEFLANMQQRHDLLYHNIKNRTISSETHKFLYQLGMLFESHDQRDIGRFCAQSYSLDSDSSDEQKMYAELNDQNGLPTCFAYNQELLNNVSISASIHTKRHAQERETLFALASITINDQETVALLKPGVACVAKACQTQNPTLLKAYRTLAQQYVNAVYDGKSDAILRCHAVATDNVTQRYNKLEEKIVPVMASLSQKVHDPHIILAASEQEQLENTLLEIDRMYGQALNGSLYMEGALYKFLQLVDEEHNKRAQSASLLGGGAIDQNNPDNFNASALSELLGVEVANTDYFDKADWVTYDNMIQDESLCKNIAALLDDAKKQSKGFIPWHVESITAQEYCNYLDDLQRELSVRTQSTIMRVLGRKFSEQHPAIITEFENFLGIGSIELLKKSIEVGDAARHPLVTAEHLVHGVKGILHFTGNLMVGYGRHPWIDSHIAEKSRQEITKAFQAMRQLPAYEKFKIIIDLAFDSIITHKFTQLLVKTKPFLTATKEKLNFIIDKVHMSVNQLEVVKKLRSYAHKEVVAIEGFELADELRHEAKKVKAGEELAATGNTENEVGRLRSTVGNAENILEVASAEKRIDHLIKIEESFKNGTLESFKEPPISFLKNGNTIKEFSSKAVRTSWRHVFSKEHLRDGIMNLAENQAEVVDEAVKLIIKLDHQSKLQTGSNQINTLMNGYQTIIRFFINNDGEVKSINVFTNTAKQLRNLGNTINIY